MNSVDKHDQPETNVPRRSFLAGVVMLGTLLACNASEIPIPTIPRRAGTRSGTEKDTQVDFVGPQPAYVPPGYRFSHLISNPPWGFHTGAPEVLSSYLKAVPGRDQPVALVVIVVQGPAGVPRMLPQSEAHGGRVTLPAPFSDAVYFDGNWLRYDGPQPERVVGRQGFKWSTSIQNTVTARLGQFTVAVIGDPTDGIRKDELLAVLRSMK